ncbi:hypothetical protein GCM10007908_24770 [Rhizobium albus]|nr:hypothetical protein GCM10007908_24770 [Rhizobium albus]
MGAQCRRDRFGAPADHHREAIDAGLPRGFRDMANHWKTGHLMEHLRQVGAHPRAFARCQNHRQA